MSGLPKPLVSALGATNQATGLSGPASSNPANTMARLKGKVAFR